YRAALRVAPSDLTTRQAVALWALENGRIDFAKEQANEALRIEEADAKLPPGEKKYAHSKVGHLLRGYVALWEKDWTEAESEFQKVIDDDPNDFIARNNIALALVEQDDPAKKNKALAYAEANYEDDNKSPDALTTLGWIYFRRNQFSLAKLALDQTAGAANENSPNADNATGRAYVLYHQGKNWQAK